MRPSLTQRRQRGEVDPLMAELMEESVLRAVEVLPQGKDAHALESSGAAVLCRVVDQADADSAHLVFHVNVEPILKKRWLIHDVEDVERVREVLVDAGGDSPVVDRVEERGIEDVDDVVGRLHINIVVHDRRRGDIGARHRHEEVAAHCHGRSLIHANEADEAALDIAGLEACDDRLRRQHDGIHAVTRTIVAVPAIVVHFVVGRQAGTTGIQLEHDAARSAADPDLQENRIGAPRREDRWSPLFPPKLRSGLRPKNAGEGERENQRGRRDCSDRRAAVAHPCG